MKKCFFIGHRETPESVFPLLLKIIKQHITEYGVSEFWVGGYGNFDRLATKAVAEIKKEMPFIRLIRLLPYHPAVRPIVLADWFDGSLYPFEERTSPARFSIVQANQYAVKHTDYLICYVNHPASNAGKLLEYAKKQKTTGITNLAI